MDNSAAKRKNPPVITTCKPIPLVGKELDKEINAMRKTLARMVEDPQKCRLLKKERENWDLEQDLNAMRVATRERLAQCKKKDAEFEIRQSELKEMVLSQESFIKDTDIKIDRAEKKAKDENYACKKANDEILSLVQDFKKLQVERESEISKIKYHLHYKQFLSSTASIYNSQKTSRWPKGDGTGNATFITQ